MGPRRLGPRVAGSPLMMGEICEWPLGYWWLGPHPLDGAVHRGSSDAEEFGELSNGCSYRSRAAPAGAWSDSASASAACHAADPSPSLSSSLLGCAVGSGRFRSPPLSPTR